MNNDIKLQLFSLAEQLGNIGHWCLNVSTLHLYWSDRIYAIHGVSPDEYSPTYASAIEFYHPGDRAKITQAIERSISGGEPFEFVLRIVRSDGETRFVNTRAQCTTGDGGEVQSVIGVLKDVTEEEIAKRESEKAQALNVTLMESSNDGFWDWHLQEDYEYMSPRFWEMFGYTPEEKLHKPSAWQEMIDQGDLEKAMQNFERHVETNGEHPYLQEVRYRHKNGSTVTVLCRGKVIEWSDDGKPLRMVGSHTDITKFKKSEQDLRTNLSFQTLLMNENRDLVFVKDDKFRIVLANTAFLSLYPEEIRDSIIGTTTIEKYDQAQAELFLAEDKKALAHGVAETEESIIFPDGSERVLMTRKVRFFDDNGNSFVLGVARDITELKVIESNLRSANEELEEFAYRTSHDLRSPLVSSRRLLGFIKKDVDKGRMEQVVRGIDMVSDALGNLESLVTEILQLTKLRYDNSESVLVNIPQAIDQALKKLSHMEGFERIKFNLIHHARDEVFLERNHIEQIIENLISNSIKYQDVKKAESIVTIESTVRDGVFVFDISDNGLGIPEASRAQIFLMFKRFHSHTSFGSGLGLYMLKKSVEKMRGSIQYVPLEDGTKFSVLVPINKTSE